MWRRSGVPLRGPGAPLRRLDLAIARRRAGHQRIQDRMRAPHHLADGVMERVLGGLRGLREAAQLADELERRCANLLVRGGRLEVVERLDATTHGNLPFS